MVVKFSWAIRLAFIAEECVFPCLSVILDLENVTSNTSYLAITLAALFSLSMHNITFDDTAWNQTEIHVCYWRPAMRTVSGSVLRPTFQT